MLHASYEALTLTWVEEIRVAWDEYQNEVIKKFYGNEPKAKKPLVVQHTQPGTIVVPGLSGTCTPLLFLYSVEANASQMRMLTSSSTDSRYSYLLTLLRV